MTLSGLFVPLITPFDAEGEVDLPVLETLANELLDAGASGLLALGTTGEPSSLTDAERRAVIDLTAKVCHDFDAPLIVGTRDPRELENVEAAAAMVTVPAFVRPGEAGVVAHFGAIAERSPLPLVVYHVPHRTAQPLSANALREIAAISKVVAFKYANGVDATAVELLADPPPGVTILGGDDAFISPILALGAHGAILASAHVATRDFAELVSAWRNGPIERARALGGPLAKLSTALFAEPNPTVIKAALHAQNRINTPDVRLPLLPARQPLDAIIQTWAGWRLFKDHRRLWYFHARGPVA